MDLKDATDDEHDEALSDSEELLEKEAEDSESESHSTSESESDADLRSKTDSSDDAALESSDRGFDFLEWTGFFSAERNISSFAMSFLHVERTFGR